MDTSLNTSANLVPLTTLSEQDTNSQAAPALPVNVFHHNSTLLGSDNSLIIRELPRDVVNKIAAGEVIHRPVNAIKELLENSLDAGATNVQIIVQDGGLTSIQIIDNGHGIARYNHELLCQRHSTSKLTMSQDLARVTTFGFRGEALASISAISNVNVTTYNKTTDTIGWNASYKDGKIVEGTLKNSAVPQGTKIFIDKIFDGIPIRKRALKSASEERKLIVNLVTRYAIHNCDKVTISLREALSSSDIVCSIAPKELKYCVGSFFGPEIERESFEFDMKNENFRFEGHILLSQATSNVKKFNLILFVNNRLVECPELKKDVDALMTEFSDNKASNMFVYISLRVNPADIDVNVHPAKTCVTLHYQSELIEFIMTSLKEKLSNNRYTKTIDINNSYSQPTLSEFTKSQLTRKRPYNSSPCIGDNDRLKLLAPNALLPTPSKRPSNLIHNHHSDRKLTELYNKDSEPVVLSQSPMNLNHHSDRKLTELYNKDSEPVVLSRSPMNPRRTNDDLSLAHKDSQSEKTTTAPRRDRKIPLKLRSLQELRLEVTRNSDPVMTNFLKQSIFVGSFNGNHALVQNSTKLYVLKLHSLLKELYYQLYLYDFGRFSVICLTGENDLYDLIDAYFTKLPEHLSANLKYSTAISVIEKLKEHCEMLEDYFSISINSSTVSTLPSLVPGEEPDGNYIGKFLVELANYVNWDDELECFRSIGQTIADYYATPPADLVKENVQRAYNVALERKLYPLMKQYLFVPKLTSQDGNFYQISDTTELYKVFERC